MKRGVRRAMVVLTAAAILGGAWAWTLCAPWPIPELSVKAFGTFEFDPTRGTLSDVPSNLRRLDGRRVSVLGEMWDPNGSGQFFVVHLLHRPWGGPPRVQDFLVVTNRTSNPSAFYESLARVSGIVHVKVERDANGVRSIFRMDAEKIEPVQESDGGALWPWMTWSVRTWLLAVVTGTVLATGAMAYVRWRRAARMGFCPRCGYDLRATPDQCPECGTIPPIRAPEWLIRRRSQPHSTEWALFALVVCCYALAIYAQGTMPGGYSWSLSWERANFLMSMTALSALTIAAVSARDIFRNGWRRCSTLLLVTTVLSATLPVMIFVLCRRWLQGNFA